MGADAKLIALLGALHLLGMGLGAALLVMFVRSDRATWPPPEDDGGGGGSDRPPPASAPAPDGGGVPLPDAEPARVRMRGPVRLADLLPSHPRRPADRPAPRRPRVPLER